MKSLAKVHRLLIVERVEHLRLVECVETLKEADDEGVFVFLERVALLSDNDHHLDFAGRVVAVNVEVAVGAVDGGDAPQILVLAFVNVVLQEIQR